MKLNRFIVARTRCAISPAATPATSARARRTSIGWRPKAATTARRFRQRRCARSTAPWSWNNVPPAYADLYRKANLPLRPNYSETQDPYAGRWATLPEDFHNLVHQFRRVYYAQTAHIDWNVGRILQVLDETRLANDTVVVFTSDHGEMFGAHGRRAKNIFCEEAIRVPWLLRWPGRVKAGQVSDILARWYSER